MTYNQEQTVIKKTFRLSEKFLSDYEDKQPNWGFGDLSYFVYKRTYARLKDDGTQEEFFDTVKRVVEGTFQIQLDHCSKVGLPWDSMRAQKSAQRMFQKIWEFKFSPPGRGLWVMGTPIVDRIGSAALNNCAFISTKDIKKEFGFPFSWATDMLMLGVGVGFDTKGAGTLTIKAPTGTPVTYQIPDTREGWVESVKILINSYTGSNPVVFDYTLIRPAGAPIRGFGGTSSGPIPLMEGHKSIAKLLDKLNGEEIDSVTIVDIMNYIGKFVVAGNVRRSAELAIGEASDKSYVSMKDPAKFSSQLMDRRWASNNSVFADNINSYNDIVKQIAKNGEPGLIYIENAKSYGRIKDGKKDKNSPYYDNVAGFNPCAEQSLEHGEMCCLVETYPANHDTAEEFIETLKYAYLYAKTVTLLPTHDPLANSVMLRNRRIGLSQSGIQQAIKKFEHAVYFNHFGDKAYSAVRDWDLVYSRWLGVPTSIKVTTVKPSGTVSLLAGATPGVHCTHSEYYYRTVRVSANDPMVPMLLKANYRVEVSVTDDTSAKLVTQSNLKDFVDIGATLVAYFAIKEKNFTKSKYDISLWEQMSLVRELQNLWSDNSVSCTITFKPEEVKDLESAIRFMAPYVKTLSFLPLDNHTYAQAPYQTITETEYKTYNDSIKPLRLSKYKGQDEMKERYCTNDSCTI